MKTNKVFDRLLSNWPTSDELSFAEPAEFLCNFSRVQVFYVDTYTSRQMPHKKRARTRHGQANANQTDQLISRKLWSKRLRAFQFIKTVSIIDSAGACRARFFHPFASRSHYTEQKLSGNMKNAFSASINLPAFPAVIPTGVLEDRPGSLRQKTVELDLIGV